MIKHPKKLYGQEHIDIAEDIANMDYRELAILLDELSKKLSKDSYSDYNRGRSLLADRLGVLAECLETAAQVCHEMGGIISPFMDKK